jgi:hypothetical protein
MMAGATIDIDYLEEGAGPGIAEIPEDLELRGAAEEEEAAAAQGAEVLPGWDQATIEQFLRGTGAGIHMLAGRAENDWLMTEKDLERIAPPLTRICNRYEAVLKLSPMADPLLAAHGFGLWGWRSALEAKRAQRDAEEAEPAGPGYERGPAPTKDEPPELNELAEPQATYFPEGDSHA